METQARRAGLSAHRLVELAERYNLRLYLLWLYLLWLSMYQLVELAEQLKQQAAPAREHADHAEARVVAQTAEQHGELGLRAGARTAAQVLPRPDRLVEDVRLVEVGLQGQGEVGEEEKAAR